MFLNVFKSTAAIVPVTFLELFNALYTAAGGSDALTLELASCDVDREVCELVHATETDCFTMGSLHMSVRSYT